MAKYKGKDGAILVGVASVGEMESFDIETTINELEANIMGSDFTDVCGGQKSATGSISVLTDPADAGQALLSVGSEVTLTLYPVGNTTGLIEIGGNFLVTSMGLTTAVGDLVKTSFNFRNQGAFTIGSVA
jgi:hypothetical protein